MTEESAKPFGINFSIRNIASTCNGNWGPFPRITVTSARAAVPQSNDKKTKVVKKDSIFIIDSCFFVRFTLLLFLKWRTTIHFHDHDDTNESRIPMFA